MINGSGSHRLFREKLRMGAARGCPGRCCKSEVGVAPPEPVGSGCPIHEEEQRREERYASIGFPGSPESSRDGGRRVGRGGGFRGSSKQLRQVLPDRWDRSASGASAGRSVRGL